MTDEIALMPLWNCPYGIAIWNNEYILLINNIIINNDTLNNIVFYNIIIYFILIKYFTDDPWKCWFELHESIYMEIFSMVNTIVLHGLQRNHRQGELTINFMQINPWLVQRSTLITNMVTYLLGTNLPIISRYPHRKQPQLKDRS